MYGVWGRGPADVFAAGHETILHFDGITWEPESTVPVVWVSDLRGLNNEVFAAGSAILRRIR